MATLQDLKSLPVDVLEFQGNLKLKFGGFFSPARPIVVARAPARLDVMGGVIDYSGGTVVEETLTKAVIVGVQKRQDRRLLVRSLGIEHAGLASTFEMSLDDFFIGNRIISYGALRKKLAAEKRFRWTGYVVGVFFVLLQEGYTVNFLNGATLGITSTVPIGAGVSSSAALEVATMSAVLDAFDLSVDGLEIARLCQMVENLVVGAPCGIMDQVTSTLGETSRLLVLKCQPHEILKMIDVPRGYRFVGFNSGVRHSVGGSRYTDARVGTFIARKIIIDKMLANDPDYWPYDGYLCNVMPADFSSLKPSLPVRIRGQDFLDKFGSLDDKATVVEPQTIYRVRSRAEHAIYEHQRVMQFIKIIEENNSEPSEQNMLKAGELMYASHWSYGRRLGLGCKETDIIVDLIRRTGPEKGLFGGKISGGGSGGTVAILAAENTDDVLQNLAAQYYDMTGIVPDLFLHSSPGALEFGTVEMTIE